MGLPDDFWTDDPDPPAPPPPPPAPDPEPPLIPKVRRVFPSLLAHDIVSVQPMSAPVAAIFTWDPIRKHDEIMAGGAHDDLVDALALTLEAKPNAT